MAESNLQKAPELLDLAQLDAPQAVSMWPQTLAWQILFALVLTCVAMYLWHRFQTYRKALWKRQALALATEAWHMQQAAPWFALIKRVTLVQQSRESVCAMTDEQLVCQLQGLDTACKQALVDSHYQLNGLLPEQVNQLLYREVVQWLEHLPTVPANSGTESHGEVRDV